VGQTGAILSLSVLFGFLFLVGLYESWIIPMPVLLLVPIGVLGTQWALRESVPTRMPAVDSELRVHGLRGLRVADASVMPSIVSRPTNAPSFMIGVHAAAMIKSFRTPYSR
jgi:hypothetical protein